MDRIIFFFKYFIHYDWYKREDEFGLTHEELEHVYRYDVGGNDDHDYYEQQDGITRRYGMDSYLESSKFIYAS